MYNTSDECQHARRLAIAISRTLAPRGSHRGLGASAVAAGAMRALALSLVALLASSVGLVSGAETFHEELLARPLPDGKVAFVAHFTQDAPLLAKHYETFPRAIAEIARTLARRRRSLLHAGAVVRRALRPSPARGETRRRRLWASFHARPPGAGVGVASPTKSGIRRGRRVARAHDPPRGAVLRLPRRPGRRRRRGAAPGVPRVERKPRRGGLRSPAPRRLPPAEAVCTENLTPWLRLLPCRDRAGVGSMLRSRRLGAPYASFTTRFETAAAAAVGTSGPRRPDPPPSQTVTLVLDPGDARTPTAAASGSPPSWASRRWAGRRVRGRRRAAHAETTSPFSAEATGAAETFDRRFGRAGILDLAPGRVGRVVLRTWDLAALRANVGGGAETTTPGRGPIRPPRVSKNRRGGGKRAAERARLRRRRYSPELLVSSAVTGTGNSVEDIDRHPASGRGRARRDERRALGCFQILPWSRRVRALADGGGGRVAQPGTPGFRSDGTAEGPGTTQRLSRSVFVFARGWGRYARRIRRWVRAGGGGSLGPGSDRGVRRFPRRSSSFPAGERPTRASRRRSRRRS